MGWRGGLVILVHEDIKFNPLDTSALTHADARLEVLGVTVDFRNSPLDILNVYSAPNTPTPDFDAIFNLPSDEAVIVGDWNAHHRDWDSNLEDAKGIAMSDALEQSQFGVINDPNCPTRIVAAGSTSPDISMISYHLVDAVEWSTLSILNSDHLPIAINFK